MPSTPTPPRAPTSLTTTSSSSRSKQYTEPAIGTPSTHWRRRYRPLRNDGGCQRRDVRTTTVTQSGRLFGRRDRRGLGGGPRFCGKPVALILHRLQHRHHDLLHVVVEELAG